MADTFDDFLSEIKDKDRKEKDSIANAQAARDQQKKLEKENAEKFKTVSINPAMNVMNRKFAESGINVTKKQANSIGFDVLKWETKVRGIDIDLKFTISGGTVTLEISSANKNFDKKQTFTYNTVNNTQPDVIEGDITRGMKALLEKR